MKEGLRQYIIFNTYKESVIVIIKTINEIMELIKQMDKGKISSYLSFHKTDQEEALVALKNGSYFVARVHHFEHNNKRTGVKRAVHFETTHFEVRYEMDDGQIFLRKRFIIDEDIIIHIDRIPKDLTSYYSDLGKLSKQCLWCDLPKNGSLSAYKKFMNSFEEKLLTQRGDELLIEAIAKGYVEALPKLNERVKIADKSLLNRVINSVQPGVLKWYFENKPIELSTDDKMQLLIEACKIGNLEIIQFLLETGFDINSIYSYEYVNDRKEKRIIELSPIDGLIEACHEDIFNWLFKENKINLTLKDFSSACIAYNGEFIAEIMIPNIPEKNKQEFLDKGLQNAAYTNKYDLFKKLLELGANINFQESAGIPMLFNAAQEDNGTMVGLMIKAGIDVNAAKYKGISALEIAREKNRTEIVALLIEAGAVDTEKNKEKVVEYLDSKKSESMSAAEFKKYYNKHFNPFLKNEGFKCDGFIAYKTIQEKSMAFFVKLVIDRGRGWLIGGAHPVFLPNKSQYKFKEKELQKGDQYVFTIQPKYNGEKNYFFIDYRLDEKQAKNDIELFKELYNTQIKVFHNKFDHFPLPFTAMSKDEFKKNAVTCVTDLGMDVFHTPPSLMREICLLFARINLFYDNVSKAKEYAELCRFWNEEECKTNDRISKPNDFYESYIQEIFKENKLLLPVSRL